MMCKSMCLWWKESHCTCDNPLTLMSTMAWLAGLKCWATGLLRLWRISARCLAKWSTRDLAVPPMKIMLQDYTPGCHSDMWRSFWCTFDLWDLWWRCWRMSSFKFTQWRHKVLKALLYFVSLSSFVIYWWVQFLSSFPFRLQEINELRFTL